MPAENQEKCRKFNVIDKTEIEAYLGTFHDDAQVQKLLNQALAKPLSVRQENLREIRDLPDDAPEWLKRKWPEGGPYHRFEPDSQLHVQVRHIAD